MIDLDKVVITQEMLSRIAEIDEFKGAWLQLGKLSPDRLSALKRVATIESIGSSTRIEGATLSDEQVAALLSQIDRVSLDSRDQQEVAGYAYACNQIFENYQSIPLTENFLKQMHQWLLQYSDKDVSHRGQYKKIPIRIEALDISGNSLGVLFEPTSPLETPMQMQALVEWTRAHLEAKSLHPLIAIGLFIVIFLAIHPFQDGNGRLSRLLVTLLMMQAGYHYVVYSSLESIIEANKESYYLALQKSQKAWQQGNPDWAAWLQFFLQCLQRQKTHLEQKVTKEKALCAQLPILQRKILDLLKEHGELKIGQITDLTQANRNTIKKALMHLASKGWIHLHGKGKGACYRIFD